jgi:hypothetical protein
MPPTPIPHALYLQLPHHHRSPVDGQPYISIVANNKSQYVWNLVKSLEISAGLYCEEAVDRASNDDDGSDEGDDEPKSMVSVFEILPAAEI